MYISVCIATYNGEKYIKDQLDSILCQLSANDEVIISDDGSGDNTTSIIQAYHDPRIILINRRISLPQKNQYPSYLATTNFENALLHATGDIIFLADQDDIWEKTKVKEILTVFETRKVNLILHDAILKDEQKNVLADSYFKIVKSKPGFLKNMIKNSYLGCCMAFDKTILKNSLPFPRHLIAHDMWLGLIAEGTGNVAFIDQKLITYQRHESTATTSGNKSKFNILFKLKYRIQFVVQYVSRIIYLKLFKAENQ
ncbi:MAG: glycosyltransferase [Prolixibacteraceae bacterium]|nr:glycosyltransferase [Prolixibacteraceae bacterium]